MADAPALQLSVLGAGAWGTALAVAFSSHHQVTLWGRDHLALAAAKQQRTMPKALPGITLPSNLRLETNLEHALQAADLVLVATDTSGLGDTVRRVVAVRPDLALLWACKGFERGSGELPHDIVAPLMGSAARYGALSGPSFALEVAKGLPVALTVACNDTAFARQLAARLSCGALRVYSNPDLIGVELGGALKNVMAIAAGICDGLNLGMNARAALITRGLAEMTRLGAAMGARAETFVGLTGLGDLVLTATGSLSRNRSVGMGLAQGRSLETILAELGHVAEGVNTAATARDLAQRHGVEMPITQAVCGVLFDGTNAHDTLRHLLARETKAE